MATATEVHFTIACLLNRVGIRFKPEIWLPSPRMRSGKFRVDLAVVDWAGNVRGLIECKGYKRRSGPNPNSRQYQNYADSGLPFIYCHSRNIGDVVEWAKALFSS